MSNQITEIIQRKYPQLGGEDTLAGRLDAAISDGTLDGDGILALMRALVPEEHPGAVTRTVTLYLTPEQDAELGAETPVGIFQYAPLDTVYYYDVEYTTVALHVTNPDGTYHVEQLEDGGWNAYDADGEPLDIFED